MASAGKPASEPLADPGRSAPLRVAFIVSSLRRAGGESQVVELVNGIDPARVDKHLFCFEADLALLERVDRSEVHFHHSLRRRKYDLSVVRAFARLIDEQRIDVIHCTFRFSLLVAWLARRRSQRKPLLVTALHTTINRHTKDTVHDHLVYRWLLPANERILFVCQSQRDYWLGRFPALAPLATVVHNGIDVARFRPEEHQASGAALREELRIPPQAFVCCAVAGFRPEKGHDHLLAAFAELPDDAVLLLAGDGVRRPQIEAIIAERGLGERVRLLGNLPDVRPVLAASNVSVLASTAVETFSLAMLESLAMETPMVASDIGGMGEAVLAGETGYLFAPGDRAALAAHLRSLAAEPDRARALGKRGRELVCSRFTRDRMIRSIEELLVGLAPPGRAEAGRVRHA